MLRRCGLALLASALLSGCATDHRNDPEARLESYPPLGFGGIEFKKNGHVAVSGRQPFITNIPKFNRVLARIHPENTGQVTKHPLTLVVPRIDGPALGTVFMPLDGHFRVVTDITLAGWARDKIRHERMTGTYFSGRMIGWSLEAVACRASETTVQVLFSDTNSDPMTTYPVSAVVSGVTIDYLDAETRTALAARVRRRAALPGHNDYLVLDTIVWARSIGYHVRHLKPNPKVKIPGLKELVLAGPGVTYKSTHYEVVERWKEPKIVAYGFSRLGIVQQDRGRRQADLSGEGAEAYVIRGMPLHAPKP